ncbi:MAG TPA: M20/M25/M40 family metallo-hydrolase [Trueperaceae bacterium]
MERMPEEVALAQRLIRAESPSGHESPATTELVAAFAELGYDEAYLDDAGNAIGILRRGEGPTVMFNGHLDVVPAGDPGEWAYPAFSGALADGQLWGRGSCDMKAAVACMAVAARDAGDAGFSGTLIVSGVVQEEVGGLGARFLTEHLHSDVIVLGEPSNLEFKLGHRGRVEMLVELPGRIAHAAKASLGENALYNAARFLAALERCELPSGGPLGASTATPTDLTTSPGGANVVPGKASITVDYRNIVEDEPQMALARLESLDSRARIVIGEEDAVSEDGKVRYRFPRVNQAYLAPTEAPAVTVAREAIKETLGRCGRPFNEGVWWFATDAPYLAARGTPVVGFGPGEPERAHTTRECVPVDHLSVARIVYRQLALAYGAAA